MNQVLGQLTCFDDWRYDRWCLSCYCGEGLQLNIHRCDWRIGNVREEQHHSSWKEKLSVAKNKE